jgi:hypothetical protein
LDGKEKKNKKRGNVMLRSNSHGIDERLDAYNRENGGYGVQALYGHNFRHHYWGDIVALYVNTGDSYTETLSYIVEEDEWIEGGCYADLVERLPEDTRCI